MSAFQLLKEAWQNRDKLGEDNKTRELAAFLPAALEIQAAPPNPAAKWLARSLIVLFLIGIIWACLAEVNIVASSEGKIIPSSRVKQIQPLEKAVVKTILVHEGEYVEKGQPLIELDSTLTKADENRFAKEYQSAQMQLAVTTALLTLLNQKTENHPQAEQLKPGNWPENSSQKQRHIYQQLLWQKWQEYQSQIQTLQTTLNKTRYEQASSREVIKKLEQTLPIINKRANKLKQLQQQNFVSETEFLELEQQRIEQTQDLAAEKQHLKQLISAENEVKYQINTFKAQAQTQTLQQQTELQRQLDSLQQELTKAIDLNQKQILYAPVAGQVQQLAAHTIGGVVTEAQQLMLIVPSEEQLEVEVFLENKDIGFVTEGMKAEIKIHTFPFTKYGVIDATVTTVSDDATVDEQRGLIYGMHLLMNKNTIWVDNKEVKLIPGMAVTAEVKTGTRRIIEFFLTPLLQHGQESLRER